VERSLCSVLCRQPDGVVAGDRGNRDRQSDQGGTVPSPPPNPWVPLRDRGLAGGVGTELGHRNGAGDHPVGRALRQLEETPLSVVAAPLWSPSEI